MQPIPTDGAVYVEPVRFKKLDDRALTPEFKTAGAAGFDLAVMEDIRVRAQTTVMVRTGLVIAVPEGHMLLLAPRSSTWNKWGVRLGNTVGVVDHDYCGATDEVLLALWNPDRYHPRVIPAHTRIAQGLLIPVLSNVQFTESDEMGESRGGWGSTGA